ncbi:acyl-ACP--UDP-N-acetylglucosamine O-acyltransferase [Rhodobaculum claviforme]|uniref:Acyl-[acyl-carrier-protein]--UDP-N-acetylglucosamine O-acyltransferase n=1 Tax=Rhodobaculum claviforme TaxID=1549854 RepID=A0A934WJ55_9RHOB|nr:acyl-ACP--UDP-N-acetylglucosamine O-acyltransferase [Rhodobaculum claviforme]MBK5927572.1 acyl-[acyl-carrier-protein]--UDP-N-acetylglucosamine O-acyltransferase [Rhodobaculum claviforme]
MDSTDAPRIHPSAVVEQGARIGAGAVIGPFSVIGAEVTLAERVEVKSHAVITGQTEIGADTVVFPFATVGEVPQDLKYRGERTRLVVGARCRIREGATLNTGTVGGGGITQVGDDCLIMTGAHVGHDARVGDRVILANQVALAGHVVVGDDVIIGGMSGIHQFVRIGRGAIIGAVTMVAHDVMPFGLVQGPRGTLEGLNLVGLRRRGVPRAEIAALRAAYATLARGEGALADRARALSAGTDSAMVREMAHFILEASDRQFLAPR